ncbi:MAG: glycoside hydrolase family 95 protein [Clostridia bacterium]|nr:glycoside hydrolase family 95 protein [Clostridia bacterium]
MYICYREPAAYCYEGWERQAVPLGNGKIGVKVFGGFNCELIQFNEKTLWSGGPGTAKELHGIVNADGGKAFREVQKLLAEGKNTEAEEKMHSLEGTLDGLGAYQAFGSLYMNFSSDAACDDYVRDLDFDTASAMVSYKAVSGAQNRHYFVSYPDNCFVGRIVPTDESKLNCDMYVVSEQNGKIVSSGDTITLKGTVNGNNGVGAPASDMKNNMRYAGVIKAVVTGGSVKAAESGHLIIADADEIMVLMSLATDYKNEYPTYRSWVDPLVLASNAVEKAAEKTFRELYHTHLNDYQPLYNRVKLDIGQKEAQFPADYMLKKYKRSSKFGLELEALLFQYGRYLLLSSSREGSLPANLQGVWNALNDPPWCCDYHLNVNLQMNYWPALVTSLAETAEPLIDYVNSLLKPGRYVANKTLGIGKNKPDGEPDVEQPTGWVVHTMCNAMGHVGPGSSWRWGWAPANGAWLMQNLYDCYAFSMDTELLHDKIYPAMQECALLWTQILVEDKKSGRLVSSPTFSPEQGPVTAGNTYEQTIVYGLYTDLIKASEALIKDGKGDVVDLSVIKAVKAQAERLEPLNVSSENRIKEWYEEDSFTKKFKKKNQIEKHHRHLSHLLGVYPYSMVEKKKKGIYEAAKNSMYDRGVKSTGWAMAMRLLCWARLRESGMCGAMISNIIGKNIYDNLFGFHPPFQIDGNFGFTAGVAEMLVQSTDKYILLAPAIAPTWKKGSCTGLRARGNFEVDVEWDDFKFSAAAITSGSGGACTVYGDGRELVIIDEEKNELETQEDDGYYTFITQKGKKYFVALKDNMQSQEEEEQEEEAAKEPEETE